MISDFTLIDQIEIPSELKNLGLVEQFIDKVCESKGLDEDVYGNVLIAVTEAVNNAIIHGNCFANDKKVKVDVLETANQICFSVMDEGVGFDFHNLPDPTAPENIEKENGRGIFLIKNLSDEMSFDEPGNVIHIFFNHD
ncbi:MAG: ATP-binding protein [Flavobacteriia bacterium]|jgi:serine/threonine-protein kinase RsbW